jgi:hypothetical protein
MFDIRSINAGFYIRGLVAALTASFAVTAPSVAASFTPGDLFLGGTQITNVTAGGNVAGQAPLVTRTNGGNGEQLAFSHDLSTAYLSVCGGSANVVAVSADGSVQDFARVGTNSCVTGLVMTHSGQLLASNWFTGHIFDITAGGDFSAASPFATNALSSGNESAFAAVPTAVPRPQAVVGAALLFPLMALRRR